MAKHIEKYVVDEAANADGRKEQRDAVPKDEVEEMYEKVKAELEAWRAGLARNFPPN
jgi:hypothetical protein